MFESDLYRGVGRGVRREVVRRWKREGKGLSLKQWARRQSPVGDTAYLWAQAKQMRAR